jgi:hypothetical protein
MQRKQHRLTDKEREAIQILKMMGPLSIAQSARAMKCHRSTVIYWRKTRVDETGRLRFVRPKGVFADGR